MQKKILRQRIIEIIGDESHNRFDAVLSLEFVDALEPQAFSRPVGRQLEYRRAIAGDENRLAALDLASELRQAIFRLANGYGLHADCIAACGYTVHDWSSPHSRHPLWAQQPVPPDAWIA